MSGHQIGIDRSRLRGLIIKIGSVCTSTRWGRVNLFSNHRPMSWSVIVVLVLALGLPAMVGAQTGFNIEILEINAKNFPEMTLQVEAWNDQGDFLSGLGLQQVEILENGIHIRPTQIDVTETNLQMTLAINVGPVLAGQEQGASQFDHLRQALIAWARSEQVQPGDVLSMSTSTGLYLIHSADPQDWIKALNDYQPDLARAQPSLNSLVEGLNLASEAFNHQIRRRAVLFITPPLPASLEANLSELSDRAKAMDVAVFVWLVAPPTYLPLSPDAPLRQIAEQSGGAFQQIYLPEGALDISSQLASFRQLYSIHYVSSLQDSGEHAISIQIEKDGQVFESSVKYMSLSVKPPNPIFLSPPAQVERNWTLAEGERAALLPGEVQFKILVEFPDAHIRDLRKSRLFVDDVMVSENTSPPFDQFTWQLENVTESGLHFLRVEVEDELGFTGSSTQLPVDVRVAAPIEVSLPARIAGGLTPRNIGILALALLSGLVFVWSLVARERKASRPLPSLKGSRVNKTPARRSSQTQPKRQAPSRIIQPLAAEIPFSAPARLINLNDDELPVVGGGILLVGQEITFGSDPKRATHVLDSPSVDGLHARLFRDPQGCFYIADNNSVAGTWINYAPVTAHGARLEHGDLVHIGRFMFRFEVNDPAQVVRVIINVIGPEEKQVSLGVGDQK